MVTAADILAQHGGELVHASAPYGPQARRERYLRTRQLKGRSGGGEVVVTGPKGKRPPASGSSSAKREQIAALQQRLSKLKDMLSQLVEAAKLRSGVETPDKPSEKTTKDSTKKAEPKTASEKKEAAKKAREDYKEVKPSQSEENLKRQIAEVVGKIRDLRAQLEKRQPNNVIIDSKRREDRSK